MVEQRPLRGACLLDDVIEAAALKSVDVKLVERGMQDAFTGFGWCFGRHVIQRTDARYRPVGLFVEFVFPVRSTAGNRPGSVSMSFA